MLKREPSGLPVLKVALVGDTATQFLATAIRGIGVARGFHIDLFEAEYNQVERQFLDPGSELYAFSPEFIILFQSTHKLLERHSMMSVSEQAALADERLAFLASVCTNKALTGTKVVCMNYPEIEDAVFGSYANAVPCSLTCQVRRLNDGLIRLAQQYADFFVCDLSGLQNKFGRDWLFAPNVYVSTEMVLSIDALPFVASRVMDVVCAIRGVVKKCLILDLDNTLWGGVIGDDGVEGIQLGHGLGIGRAFTELQQWIRKLRQRGIILCVVSKNDEATAKQPFLQHPEMVLRLSDIAVFLANWETKVDNIRTLQRILNIGFDAMVFLDDNSFEREMVREHIPGITVPELPADPALYLEYLYSLNLFETASYSTADADRTRQYQVEAQRVQLAKTFESEDDFLRSLDMKCVVSGFTTFNTPRVAQLTQRSNQFNLRTVRYTEADIAALAADPKVIDLCFTLSDRLGDHGLIAVVVMKPMDATTLFIDTWLMSCRVLKRGVEHFVLNELVDRARQHGFERIVGEYLPTAKNKMVEHHYEELGFERENGKWTMENGKWKMDNGQRFVLTVQGYQKKECWIMGELTN